MKLFRGERMLFNKATDPSDGSGGGGESEDSQFVTKADLESMVAKVANQAVSSQLSRSLPKALEAALPSLEGKLTEAIQKAITPKAADGEAQAKSKPNDAMSAEMAALKKQLEDQQKKFEQSEARRVAAENKSRDDSAKAELKQMLAAGGKGVRPELLDVATDLLFDARKAVQFSEEGSALFASPDGPFPLKEGVASWLKSDEAKPFLPAPTAKAVGPTQPFVPRAPQHFQDQSVPLSDDERIRRAIERSSALSK